MITQLLLFTLIILASEGYQILQTNRRSFVTSTAGVLAINLVQPPCVGALDLDDPPPEATTNFLADTKPIVTLLDAVVNMLSTDSTMSDDEISKFVQSDLFPHLKTWALEWGYKPGLINYKKRAYAEPESHKNLLLVFDELKKNVEQPKPGVPIKKLSKEEVVKLKEMLASVSSSME
ncbi:hypothetical protein TrLO_g12640 [Triparma laevis f. longispina]|uniref:Uncharacterized protein n=1 Tax=Triparma laevis f. longispina TaxID=1714387 RepID=A0A9W7CLN9_9STRA|nr:hypothetical protein TrLO_g12640 [Triparma laevis f. longispina]